MDIIDSKGKYDWQEKLPTIDKYFRTSSISTTNIRTIKPRIKETPHINFENFITKHPYERNIIFNYTPPLVRSVCTLVEQGSRFLPHTVDKGHRKQVDKPEGNTGHKVEYTEDNRNN